MTAIEDAREVAIRTDEPWRESWAISLTTGTYTDTLRMTEAEARLVHRALSERLAPPTDDEREARLQSLRTALFPWSADQSTEACNIIRELLDEVAGFCRQGPITDEWEYGVEYEVSSTESVYTAAHSERQARKWVEQSPTDTGLRRRRKAGPWEPVEATRDETNGVGDD